eukprot:TRINITY_DN7677_c0_g1_i1.p1 TRINITY_DN7677_c0_g1~~TRINITY_DN7677_c0_g1_i1.p1  ORF type:complete len:358 (-),score=20.83 TRINITY_DN7677_c0_g1_i1:61-1134(-)
MRPLAILDTVYQHIIARYAPKGSIHQNGTAHIAILVILEPFLRLVQRDALPALVVMSASSTQELKYWSVFKNSLHAISLETRTSIAKLCRMFKALRVAALLVLSAYFIASVASKAPEAEAPVFIEPPVAEICTSCAPGSISTSNCSTVNNETACDPGHCLSTYNCTLCSKGQYTSKWNSTHCDSCYPGTFSPAGATRCTTCARGYVCLFNPTTNSTIMKLCPPGFYCPDEGMYGGYSCPVGSYCPDFGMTAPQNCPKGYYCPTIQTTVPTICDAGFFCPSQSSSPLACGAMLTSQPGADGCYPTAGMYILIVVSALLVIGLVAWLWLRSSRPAQTNTGSLETASLIPEPEGPKYTGL